MRFSGFFPKFECSCGELALGGQSGTLVIDGGLFLECQACKKIYKFDCRLQEQSFTRDLLVPVKEQDNESRPGATGS